MGGTAIYDREEKEDARWKLLGDGSILWAVAEEKRLPHEDHIEMSGKFVSLIVRYGADSEGNLVLSRDIVYPMLRTIPNNTHASLIQKYGTDTGLNIRINGKNLSAEKVYEVVFNGVLTVKTRTREKIDITRTIFPAVRQQAVIEEIVIKNCSEEEAVLDIEPFHQLDTARGTYGVYILEVCQDAPRRLVLHPMEENSFGLIYSGRKLREAAVSLDIAEEKEKRITLVQNLGRSLCFECPDTVLNAAFNLAKIRTAESIFETKGGLMHSPGGGNFYAAVWTNDQGEYAGPLFPLLGYPEGNEAALNCFRLYGPFMGPDYTAIPSSIIAEGIDIWEGAGDRGDAAMYAYGAARFALEMGRKDIAEELWPYIEWCVEYCKRKTTKEGIIASDSDELENRFPSGEANLSTSCLAFDALHSAAYLASALGKSEAAAEYNARADKLCIAIERYFGAKVDGYDTYRYYEGNDVLRAWICLPLAMGITNRKEGTIAALFSPRLWTKDGLATQAGDTTFWDRSTLYGLKGVFHAGETKRALEYFKYYTKRRLLGEHVPYAVEAYPEGNQRQLSGESALYCKVVTEGLVGIRPTGFDSFCCTPRLPEEWEKMSLRSVRAFQKEFDISVRRSGGKLILGIAWDGREQQYPYAEGETIEVKLV